MFSFSSFLPPISLSRPISIFLLMYVSHSDFSTPIPSLPTHPLFLTSPSYLGLDFPLIFGSWLPTHSRFLTSHSSSVLDFPFILGSWLSTHPRSWLHPHFRFLTSHSSSVLDFPLILGFWLPIQPRFLTSYSSSYLLPTSLSFSVLDFPLIFRSWLPIHLWFLTSHSLRLVRYFCVTEYERCTLYVVFILSVSGVVRVLQPPAFQLQSVDPKQGLTDNF